MRDITQDDFNEDDAEVLNVKKPQQMEYIPTPGLMGNFEDLDKHSARLRTLEHGYQTPEDKLAELTYLGAHEPAMLAFQMMFDDMSKPQYVVGTAFERWRHHFFSLRRSVRGKHLDRLYGLAEAGMLTEEQGPSGKALELD